MARQLTNPAGESVWDYPRPPRRARYYDVVTAEKQELRAAWCYPDPVPAYRGIRDHVVFYPSKMDVCCVEGEKVRAQEGDFYGGWVNSDVVGPFKGGPGTWGW